MSDVSAIEWTDATWNAVTGCTRISPGCANCYIERTVPFRTRRRRFERVGNAETTGVEIHRERLAWPAGPGPRRRARELGRPIRVFVNSLSDLWHEDVPDTFVAEVFDAMAKAPPVIGAFQVLTKRPKRALEWMRRWAPAFDRPPAPWPLPNVWIGVSVENSRFTWRADVLREIPAAVRFISAEPLLGSLFAGGGGASAELADGETHGGIGAGTGLAAAAAAGPRRDGSHVTSPKRSPLDVTAIDWLIAGGESGPRARPMDPDWARELRDACDEAGVAFFFKQWGGATSKSGGRELDGRTHDDMPSPVAGGPDRLRSLAGYSA